MVHPLSASAATRYVWQDSPSPAPPFTSWAAAATNIQHAIDLSQNGDTVLVTNGIYATGGSLERVRINKPITVISVTGPQHTVIIGAPGMRCVYVSAGAILSGFTLTNGTTTSNDLGEQWRGGGAWCEPSAVLTNCIVRGNSARNDGAGVYGGVLYRCEIRGNSGDGDGGGADHSVLYNCIVAENRGRKGGGVDDCTVYNSILTGNDGRVFGGGAARSTLYNCTVIDNSSRRGGGVSECRVYNSIVYHNRAAVGSNYMDSSSPIYPNTVFTNSCTTPLPEHGSGNISSDPQLASWTHLSSTSPCIGAGLALYATGVDIDGQPWGSPPCIGADQLTLGAASGPLSVRIDADFVTITAGFVARFRLDVVGQTTSTRWDSHVGMLGTNQLEVRYSWQTPGSYPIRLTAYNDSFPSGVMATAVVQVVETPLYFVDPCNATPAFPYLAWATAATNIQDAIRAGNVAGRVVLVTNGVFSTGDVIVYGQMMNRIALTNGVVVRSVNGPRVTVIRGSGGLPGDGAVRCAFIGKGSVLDGFTLTDGTTRALGHVSRERGGGGAWCERRGTATNCVFIANEASLDGGGANGGVFLRCSFIENRAGDDSGAADDAELYDCTLEKNTAGVGAAAGESLLVRCRIADNTAAYGAGGVLDSTVRECILMRNTAPLGFGGGAAFCDLINCVLTANDAYNYGGVVASRLDHCTVVSNTAAGNTGGVYESVVRNSIVYDNRVGSVLSNHAESIIHYSCTIPTPPSGIGNISAAPLFVNAANSDYHLRPGSPGIDAAGNLGLPVVSDLDGNPRPIDGNKDSVALPDVGAYEFNRLFLTSISRVGGHAQVCWFENVPGMRLETSPTVSGASWTDVALPASGDCVDLSLGTLDAFFRLVWP